MSTNSQQEDMLVPVRILNEFAYCPRLAYMEWVECEFEDNMYTLDGNRVHRRVDDGSGDLPEPEELQNLEDVEAYRSVMLSSETEGMITKMDIVEFSNGSASPVDYKRGKVPNIPEGAYEPEQVQLCGQALILKDNGYSVSRGFLYFAGSKTRVEIEFDEALINRTRTLLEELKQIVKGEIRPAPLIDSSKCGGCSLNGICLPDEIGFIGNDIEPIDGLRRLSPARDDALPLYVQQHGLRVGKKDNELVVKDGRKVVASSRLTSTSQVSLFGNIGISAQAMNECFKRSIPICHFSGGGYFYGISHSIGLRNAELKTKQILAISDKKKVLSLSKRFVEAKITNQRTLLRRNNQEIDKNVLSDLKRSIQTVSTADSLSQLLGIEGAAARLYFANFKGMLKQNSDTEMNFNFNGRNRRPPTDPVNAMLSYLYSLLAKDCTVTLMAVGFEPFAGFYHQPRFGRPALALDFMEEYRAVIADSVVLSLVNNKMVTPKDFVKAAKSVAMKPKARKTVISAYERRMDTLVTHPIFGYRISWRRILEVQARLLARYLAGELDSFPSFTPR